MLPDAASGTATAPQMSSTVILTVQSSEIPVQVPHDRPANRSFRQLILP